MRPVVPQDRGILVQLYATTREDIQQLPWTESQKSGFCESQFEAQDRHYRHYFPDASFDLIMLDEQAVGRICVDKTEDEIRVVDISLFPEYRHQGIGSQLMARVIEEAEQQGKPVRLRVQPNSPARHWYQRLGFSVIADEQVNWHMQRHTDR